MSDNFYTPEGIKGLRKLRDLRPTLFKAFQEFDAKVFEDGALPAKTKELIATAAAHITQCPYCIDTHVKRAKMAGATDEEVAESVFVAMALGAGGPFAHGSIAMHALEHK
jgi:AhpD family alkylhydroperoxidase